MSHQSLRTCAAALTVLGWVHWVFFLTLGFVPWFMSARQMISMSAPWEIWAVYLSPVGGFILGGLTALGYFIGSQLIQVFLDQRDFLEELLVGNRRLLRIMEGKKPAAGTRESELFRLDQSLDDDLPSL